jgi:hypothetical protein
MASSLPELAEHLTAHLQAPSLLVGKDAPVSGDDRNTEPVSDPWQIADTTIDPTARLGNPTQTVNGRLAIVRILEIETNGALGPFLEQLEGSDESLLLENLRYLELHL